MATMQMPNLAKSVIAVMKAVKGIDKNTTVGTGNSSYKGVSDQDVKQVIGDAMAANGLCILPIGIDANLRIERWEESGGQYGPKQKQSVFTEVKTKYLLMHESGECVELSGYGHGVDAQDKSAGKAATYALKYLLLYTFLVPTGKIDDTDTEHSDHKDVPANNNGIVNMPWLNEGTPEYAAAVRKLITGETTIEKIKTVRRLSAKVEKKLAEDAAQLA